MISVGVVTPHGAAGADAEWPLMVGEQVGARTARIPGPGGTLDEPGIPPTSASGLRALATPAALDAAITSLDPRSLDAIGYASTSTGYALGHRAEVELVRGLEQRWGVPAESTSAAAVTALRELGIDRLALVHPPWFPDETNALGSAYFGDAGFDVVACESAGLPNDPARIEPADVVAWIVDHTTDATQALFLGGNGFRAVSAIAPLEAALGRPVLTSNQSLLWALLRKLDFEVEVSDYGSVFDLPTAT